MIHYVLKFTINNIFLTSVPIFNRVRQSRKHFILLKCFHRRNPLRKIFPSENEHVKHHLTFILDIVNVNFSQLLLYQ